MNAIDKQIFTKQERLEILINRTRYDYHNETKFYIRLTEKYPSMEKEINDSENKIMILDNQINRLKLKRI